MKKIFIFVFTSTLLLFSQVIFGQQHSFSLDWEQQTFRDLNGDNKEVMTFDEAIYVEEYGDLPVFYYQIQVKEGWDYKVQLKDLNFEPLFDTAYYSLIEEYAKENIIIKQEIARSGEETLLLLTIMPFKVDVVSGFPLRVKSFSVELYKGERLPSKGNKSFADNSVLAQGDWYKFGIEQTGIYKLSYADLQELGIDVSSLDPKYLRLYGNGGWMLPEPVGALRYDDLQENAIFVYGQEDGSFDSGDYILFYGVGANRKVFTENGDAQYEMNLYSTKAYYFLTVNNDAVGKRIEVQSQSTGVVTHTLNSYTELVHHEEENVNLNHSGRMWLGEKFDFTTEYEFDMNVPNLDESEEIQVRYNFAAASKSVSNFKIYINENLLATKNISSLSGGSYPDLSMVGGGVKSTLVPNANIAIKITYSKPLSGSVGYLDYFSIKAKCHLQFTGGQLAFRDYSTVGTGNVTKFMLNSSNSSLNIWDVSDRINVKKQEYDYVGGKNQFKIETDDLREFVAFDGSSYGQVELVGKIGNQNLHALTNVNMLIIAYPDFVEQAQRLADYHASTDNYTTTIVTPEKIYEEFGSGSKDITAIRDFIRVLYYHSPEKPLKYVLLFGDASYDYKGITYPGSDFVPIWENDSSPMSQINSVSSDDYYGQLTNDALLDVALGRFVVGDVQQAKDAVDKTLHYVSQTETVFGDWRNVATFLGDDEDGGIFVDHSEEMSDMVYEADTNFNVDKIYLDAYEQISTPSGDRYPDVEEAISRRINKGTLVFNYIGHGGEGGFAHERVIKISDIVNWDNYDKLPLFITATCELARFDNPARVSAGEYMITNAHGGAIGMITTTRPTYAGANLALSKKVYTNLFEKVDGKYMSMGEALQYAKNAKGGELKFVFLGDPAVKLAIPENNVNVLEVSVDTIKALAHVAISGNVTNQNNVLLDGMNGETHIKVYDKFVTYSTLGNDPTSPIIEYQEQDHLIFNGKVSLKNGLWSVDFIVPKDIIYTYGLGKISLYAEGEDEDARGYQLIVVGGIEDNAVVDDVAPEVELTINDWSFQNGGLTHQNPIVLAKVYDESGINTSGAGIGHNLELVLDNTKSYVVNEYYETAIDDFTHGFISYPMYNLEDGPHTLTLKVWDVYNNSGQASIDFVVVQSGEMAIDYLMNYPNPFSYYMPTYFAFEHNQAGEIMDVELRVYSTNGQLVKVFKKFEKRDGFKYQSEGWNGETQDGQLLMSGTYVYKLYVKNASGKYDIATSKLVYIR